MTSEGYEEYEGLKKKKDGPNQKIPVYTFTQKMIYDENM
jgi:hypothetical protein